MRAALSRENLGKLREKVDDELEKAIRWIKPGPTARQVYALPQSIPWLIDAPPPSLEDLFLNLSVLHAASRAAESAVPSSEKWPAVASMCEACEEASVLMENFEYSRALESLELAEQAHACAFVHWQRCICHLELLHPEQALAAAYHASSMAPRCAVFWRVLGELCQERGMPSESAKAFERAFLGGERTPSVIAGMKASGLLVPNPALSGEMLVSPAVARAILQVHIKSATSRRNSADRLRELASASLGSGTTSDVALEATAALVSAKNPPVVDACLHAEALWSAGEHLAAQEHCRRVLSLPSLDISPDLLSRMVRKVLPSALPSLVSRLRLEGRLTMSSMEELFDSSDPSAAARLDALLAESDPPPLALAFCARRLGKNHRRRSMDLAKIAAAHPGSTAEVRLMAARTLMELGEHENAAAAVSTVPVTERGNWGQFMLAESLWQMGHPDLALGILEGLAEENDEALAQNIQMRLAQCRGFMRPLQAPASISPTGRLVRPILVSGSSWTSVVAPSGLPSSSYIRVQIDRLASPDEYRVVEMSRSSGESLLGTVSVEGKHDLLALAVDPDGRIFVGARRASDWVEVSLREE